LSVLFLTILLEIRVVAVVAAVVVVVVIVVVGVVNEVVMESVRVCERGECVVYEYEDECENGCKSARVQMKKKIAKRRGSWCQYL